MKPLLLLPSETGKIIADNLKKNTDAVFVFSTDIACSSWAEWAVTHPETTGTTAVPQEQFIAWDTFKSSMMNAKVAGKSSIPSLLRKIFIRTLIKQNAEQCAQGNPLFKSIINPAFADKAFSFTDWIAKILPSLETWHKKYAAWRENNREDSDCENADYMTLYTLYTEFLDKHNLFEPSWIMPDFSSGKNTYYVFYPETLEDFSDYKDMLFTSPNVEPVMLPEDTVHIPVSFYSNSRTELRMCALKIRNLVKEKKVRWTDIAVSVPDIDTWRPYIEREFNLYCIPFVTKAGEPYTSDSAGRIFREIQNCFESDFTYETVRALLLDGYIPWNNPQVNENLVREGCERKCICSYSENGRKVDAWENALKASNSGNTTEREYTEYQKLKKSVKALCAAESFKNIQKEWFVFKSTFLNETEFTADANLILGRCMKVLADLIAIENEYVIPSGYTVPAAYSFFLNELENSTYQKQNGESGVSVFKYRTSSAAQFKYQFVVDCSQKQLTVPYRSLSFLNRKKREELIGAETDCASDAFVRLYAQKDTAYFSASQDTFGGFAIPYSLLTKRDSDELLKETELLTGEDFITSERISLSEKTNGPDILTAVQKQGFEQWKKHIAVQKNQYKGTGNKLEERIKYLLVEKRAHGSGEDKNIHISQTDLKNFFPCRRRWLFNQVLKLSDDSLDTSLMETYDAGSINHKILELFMRSYRDSGKLLPVCGGDGQFPDEKEIKNLLLDCAEKAFTSGEMNFYGKPLVLTVLEAQKELFAENILSFLKTFCGAQNFGGYKVVALEQWIDASDMEIAGVSYIGKLDCILSNEAGGVSIVDYKNSAAPAVSDCIADENDELGDFQIPLYVTLWNNTHREQKAQKLENALFVTIKDAVNHYVVQSEGNFGAVTPEEYEKTVKAFSAYTKEFSNAVQTGRLGITGDQVNVYNDCYGCSFKTICRTAYISSGVKLNAAEKGN